jgi:hypothetical protein
MALRIRDVLWQLLTNGFDGICAGSHGHPDESVRES